MVVWYTHLRAGGYAAYLKIATDVSVQILQTASRYLTVSGISWRLLSGTLSKSFPGKKKFIYE